MNLKIGLESLSTLGEIFGLDFFSYVYLFKHNGNNGTVYFCLQFQWNKKRIVTRVDLL